MDVPCGTCRACCKQDVVVLGPGDNLLDYRWHLLDGLMVLDRKDNGECVYLTPHGCGIHDRAPRICKRFDCRELVRITPPEKRAQRITENPTLAAVYAAGLERM